MLLPVWVVPVSSGASLVAPGDDSVAALDGAASLVVVQVSASDVESIAGEVSSDAVVSSTAGVSSSLDVPDDSDVASDVDDGGVTPGAGGFGVGGAGELSDGG